LVHTSEDLKTKRLASPFTKLYIQLNAQIAIWAIWSLNWLLKL